MLFTDLVGSTRLKEELGNTEAVRLILEHHALVRGLLREYPDGFEISTAGDSFFLAFRRPSDAVAFALRLQGRVEQWNRGLRAKLLDRVGIHTGEVTVEGDGEGRIHDLHGLEVDKCARVMSLGREHHILVTRFAFENARASLKGVAIPEVGTVDWVSHGLYALKGVAEPMEICEVAESGRTGLQAPEDSEKARRVMVDGDGEGRGDGGSGATAGRRTGSGVGRRGRRVWVGMGLVTVAGWLGLAVPSLVEGSYDGAYWLRPVTTPTEAVLVPMDRKSHDELKQPWMGQWDRSIHGAFVDRMRAYGARAVVFDVVFDTARDDAPEQDAAFVEAVRKATNVCVAGERRDLEREGLKLVENAGPFAALESVTRWGVSWFPARVDQVVRRPYLGNEQKEGLAAAVVRMLGKEPPAQASDLWLNYYGPPSTFAWHSYSDVMMERVPGAAFEGKIVFVGAVYDLGYAGGRRLDDVPTPYSAYTGRRSPGVEVVATSTLNFLKDESLRRTPWWVEVLGLGGMGFFLAWGLGRLRFGWALVGSVGVGLTVAFLGMASVWWTHVWFPWMTVGLVQIPVALGWAGWNALAGSGAQNRRGATRTGGTKDRPGSVPGGVAKVGPVAEAEASKAGAGRVLPSEPAPGPGGVASSGVSIPDYRLLRVIGRGAYGTVWLARDAVGLVRALKVVERRSFGEARPYEREFEGIRKFMPISLEHPGLIRIFHVGRDDAAGYFYYVMEAAEDLAGREIRDGEGDGGRYVPRTLDAELKRRGALGAREALRLGLELGSALKFLHDHQLIHRDIKPANVLYVRGQPRLGDIGLVTSMAPSDGRVSFLGTKGYMAPEGPGTASADVYSLGKLLFVAATGAEPDAFPVLPDDVEGREDRALLLGLNEVWLKACEPEAAQRMATTAEWLAALETLSREGASDATGTAHGR